MLQELGFGVPNAGGAKPGAPLATLTQLHGQAVSTARRAAAAVAGATRAQLRAFAAALYSPYEAQLTRYINSTVFLALMSQVAV